MGNAIVTILLTWFMAFIRYNLVDVIHVITFDGVTSLLAIFSRYVSSFFIKIWKEIIARIEMLCQRNQISINFIYEVFGKSLEIAENRVAITRRDVPAPMNLSPKSDISINKVEYPKSHSINVGINVFSNWFVKLRIIWIWMVNRADFFE